MAKTSPPISTPNADNSVFTFTGLDDGDTLSIHGKDKVWHIIGTGGKAGFVWTVPKEFDNWFVWVKRNGASESDEVAIPQQLHYAPANDAKDAKIAELTATNTAQAKAIADIKAALENVK